MSTNDRIEMALKRRPSDEREYDEPLRALTDATAGPARVRPRVTASGLRAGRTVPRLAAVALVMVVGAGVVGSLALRSANPAGPTPIDTGAQSHQLIGCWGQQPAFDSSLLSGSGSAHMGDTPAAAVLRAFLVSIDGSTYPDHAWHVVSESADTVWFMAPANDQNGPEYTEVITKRGTSGKYATDGWSVGSYGFCSLRVIPPAGYGSATWALDPAYPITPADTELHLLVTEEACHGSETTAADRIRSEVAYNGTSVVVTVTVRLQDGAQTCPAPPPASYTVSLSEPLGRRALFDGGPWPGTLISSILATPTPTPTPTSPTPALSIAPAPTTPTVTSQKVIDRCKTSTCNWMLSLDKPVVSGPASSALINDQVDVAFNAYIAEFKAAVGEDAQNPRSLLGTYSVALTSPRLLTIRVTLTEDTGGVFTEVRVLNFRVTDGQLISLDELFSSQTGALDVLSNESRRMLPDQLAAAAGAPLSSDDLAVIQTGTEPLLDNFDTAWLITPAGLEIIFQTGQVAGRWAGNPTVTIPWHTLAGVIDPVGPVGEFIGTGPSEQPDMTFQVYMVVPGDTMSGIAAAHGVTVAQLQAANPQIPNSRQLEAGTYIYIPWASWVYPTP